LKPTGNLFAFCTYNTVGTWHTHYDAYERGLHGLPPVFDRFQRVIWHITNPAVSNLRAGYMDACQDIAHCYNKGHTWNFQGQRGKGTGVLAHNFIEGPHCGGHQRLKDENGHSSHPTQKPEYVTDWIIERATNPGDLVLDCFKGLGSCGASALRMGRRFIGIERDERYYDAAVRRLGEATYERP
jgi:site-specific DNA-methyltransferase (adenine-specific)/modification methylase